MNSDDDALLLSIAQEMFPENKIISAKMVDGILKIEMRLPGSIKFIQITGELADETTNP